ncbi:hypothetical protein CU103_20490 [Phyllobacterium sophorae]|uniref:YtkA-like domain-containing protein n=1 Tax=Phyllobacterium sophorae TaxID=1520277 RepID=A0A2P7B6X3_9HYPH|nr:hypothetical protein CU103_20490 [Phyllobacterium sophorae]
MPIIVGGGVGLLIGYGIDKTFGLPGLRDRSVRVPLVSSDLAATCVSAAKDGDPRAAARLFRLIAEGSDPGPLPPPRLRATIVVDPPHVGDVSIRVIDLEKDGLPAVDTAEIIFELSKPSFGLGPFRHTIGRSTDGSFTVPSITVAMNGYWAVKVTAVDAVGSNLEATNVLEIV